MRRPSHFGHLVLHVVVAILLATVGALELRLFPLGSPPRDSLLFTPAGGLLANEMPSDVLLEVGSRRQGEVIYLDVTVSNLDDIPLVIPMPLAETVGGYVREGWLVLPSLTRSIGHPVPDRRPPCYPLARPEIYVGPGQVYRETLALTAEVRADLDAVSGDRAHGAIVVFDVYPFDDPSVLEVEQGSLYKFRPGRAHHRLAARVDLPQAIETSATGEPILRTVNEMPPCPPLVTPRWRGGLEKCSRMWPGGVSSEGPPPPRRLSVEELAIGEARIYHLGDDRKALAVGFLGVTPERFDAEHERWAQKMAAEGQTGNHGIAFRHNEAFNKEWARLAAVEAP